MLGRSKIHIISYPTTGGDIFTYCGRYVTKDKAAPTWSDEISCKQCKKLWDMDREDWK